MLAALSIRNIVLIEKLDLAFGPSLTVFTGETGAGKSIVLDSLALALGARGDGNLVRAGATEGQVTARFELTPSHPAFGLLSAQGFGGANEIVLRRHQAADGRTRSFINDIPATVGLMREVGRQLVEIHGQHDDRALTESASHRNLVDLYGGLRPEAAEVSRLWHEAQSAAAQLHEAEIALAQARRDAEFVRHSLAELESLTPLPQEEAQLATQRQSLLLASRLHGDLEDMLAALSPREFPAQKLNAALRRIGRHSDLPKAMADIAAALDRVLIEADEARSLVEAALNKADSTADLAAIEERLFRLRAVARKHRVAPDDLPELHSRFAAQAENLALGEDRLTALAVHMQAAQRAYREAADALSLKRKEAAKHLDQAVSKQLKPLKLEKARFSTQIERLNGGGGPSGHDALTFMVATNPGSKPGPLMKIASGGELARFILALKVAMSERTSAPVMIFDEIDTGVGGATAAAIGQKLAGLGRHAQVIAITHSPQVAAQANSHYRLFKTEAAGDKITLETSAEALDAAGRREEIARMLAGVLVTDEARAAADRLMGAKP
jgi:DNA repair protein RecN (Recombination protein N)